ncbi:hypothetical protein Tco_0060477, partial [Tanacetum coccineum]
FVIFGAAAVRMKMHYDYRLCVMHETTKLQSIPRSRSMIIVHPEVMEVLMSWVEKGHVTVLGAIPIYHMSLFKVPKKVLQRLENIRCHFFHGIENNERKPIWVKWSKVLASIEKGGLGVSSFFALNRAILFK